MMLTYGSLIAAVALMLSVANSAVAAPVVTHVTDPTPPGKLFNVLGGGWVELGPQVRVMRLRDTSPGEPPTATPAVNMTSGEAAPVLVQEEQVLTCSMPGGRFGVVAVQVQGAAGWSTPFLINRPRADWLSTDRAVPGQVVRVLGRTLTALDLYPERDARGLPVSYGGYVSGRTRVALRDARRTVPVRVEKMSAYDVHFRLPEDLRPGRYEVFVHNGYGGPAGWSEPLELEVRAAEVWPQEVFNVRDFGALGDGKADDAPAIQAALEAARDNGGGIVYLPPGSYLINSTLTVYPRTVVRGESLERTWIWLPNGVHYGTQEAGLKVEVGLQGDRDFVVEHLTMHGVYVRHLIMAPIAFTDRTAPPAENVTVQHARLLMEPTLRHPYRRGDPFLENERLDRDSPWSHRFCVNFRGDYLTVRDSHLRGGGSCVHLEGGRHCTVQRNELLKGSGHAIRIFPSGTVTPENNIFEDNITRPISNVHSATMWTHVRANRYYIARNQFESDWCRDNENICWHSLQFRVTSPVRAAGADSVRVDVARLAEWAGRQQGWPPFMDQESGELRPGALVGYDCLVVKGTGLGQLRVITDNTGDTVTLDRPWDLPPGEDSLVAICQNPQFQGHIVVDNTVDYSGPGIAPWGNAYDMVIDGNRLMRSGGINLCDVGSENSYREWAGNFFIQVLNNTMAEGRYHGKWDTRAATHIFQGTMGLDPQGASMGIAGVDWAMRNNRTETDALMCVVPSRGAQYRGILMEDNAVTTSLSGIWVGAGVSGAARGNSYDEVEEPLRDTGSSMWLHPAEQLEARLQGLRAVLRAQDLGGVVNWTAADRESARLRGRPAEDPRLTADAEALLRRVWGELAAGEPRGGYPLAVLQALVGLELQARPEGSLAQVLGMGAGGEGVAEVLARTAGDAPQLEVSLQPEWPRGWTAAERPDPVSLLPAQEQAISVKVQTPAGAWGAHRVPVTVALAWEGVPVQGRAEVIVGRGDITEWQVIGPFANPGQGGKDPTAHPPEGGVNLQGEYEGMAEKVRWQPASGAATLNLAGLYQTQEPATAYAVASLRAARPLTARLTIAADDGMEAWLNQVKVASSGPDPATVGATVSLQEGDNFLLCKVTNKGGGWFLRVSVEALGPYASGNLQPLAATELVALAALNPVPIEATAGLQHTGGVAWAEVLSDDFQGMTLAAEWRSAGGEWKVEGGTLRGAGPGAFICYREPLAPPVRIEYHARSADPSDLSACWTDSPGDYMNGYLFAWAAGNAQNRLDAYGSNLTTSNSPLAKPGQWHHVIAQVLTTGRLQLIVDGQMALEHQVANLGQQARYAGLWTWGRAEFDNVTIYRGGTA